MLTYILLDSVFILGVIPVIIMKRHQLSFSHIVVVALALFLLTAVFDNLIIYFGICYYNQHHISGIFFGRVPLEDFAYPLVAAILIPALWRRQK
jgi:lycopene cyclase domain-containing protein